MAKFLTMMFSKKNLATLGFAVAGSILVAVTDGLATRAVDRLLTPKAPATDPGDLVEVNDTGEAEEE